MRAAVLNDSLRMRDIEGRESDEDDRLHAVGVDDGLLSPAPQLPPTVLTPLDPENSRGELFPIVPSSGPNGAVAPRRVDVNVYAHKKTLAQGMMDLALLSANANQLRYVFEMGSKHPYYYPSLVLINMSLVLQIAVGVGLIINSQYNIKKERDIEKANRINNFTMIGIFLVTILNVFISAFGVGVDRLVVVAEQVDEVPKL